MSEHYYTVVWDSFDHPDPVITHITLTHDRIGLRAPDDDGEYASYNVIMRAVADAETQPGMAMEDMALDELQSVYIYAIFRGHLQSEV